MASYQDINILLVDHDSVSARETYKLLHMCPYKVLYVELASAAISMLLNSEVKFDIVIAPMNSPDCHSFKLLEQAVSMGSIVLLLSDDENPHEAVKALENGAFLYLQKPIKLEFTKCLWQYVVKERLRMAAVERKVFFSRGVEFKDTTPTNEQENPNDNQNVGDAQPVVSTYKGGMTKNNRRRNGGNVQGDDNNSTHRNNVNKKMCTEWTQELHQKFMDAVEKLGEGRCFPKDILEMMNVPGLTRMQVASHLQKCRNDNWRSPEERKINQTPQPIPQEINVPPPKQRRFGSKPQLGKSSSSQDKEETQRSGPKREKTLKEDNNNATSGFKIFEPIPYNIASSSKQQSDGQSLNFHHGFLMGNVSEPGTSRNFNFGNGVHYFNPSDDQHDQVRNCACMKEGEGRNMDNRSHWSSGASSSSDRSMNKFA